MPIEPRRLLFSGLLVLLLGPQPALAEESGFDQTVRQLAGHCVRAAATSCVERAFAAADANGDGVADLEELQALDARTRVWTEANVESLNPADLRALRLGFLLVDAIGLERGMMLYDDDGDGGLSLEEASADLNLDDRPLPEIVRQREIVDWPSLRRRFGATAMLFDYLDIR
jgi:hypothetical protein